MQNAAAGFLYNKYWKIDDVLNLNWLPIKERICMNIGYKGLHDQYFPDNLKLWYEITTRNSRRKEFQEKIPCLKVSA